MTRTALPKLDKTEWDAVKDLATTLTGYDPDGSAIKGKKTMEVLTTVLAAIKGGDYVEAERLVELLMHREAFNTMVGIEGKNRRRSKARSAS